MSVLQVPSYAKINLGLEILRRRDDGFHEIRTILHQVSLKDDIALAEADTNEIRFSCDDPKLPQNQTNLCVRAALALQEATGCNEGADIRLTKRIPFGAGLGGGSSNAAAVLLALNKVWKLGLAPRELRHLAARLGSDVPFFIDGGTAFASGRGEILEPLTLPQEVLSMTILLVTPPISISTVTAYSKANLSLTNNKKYLTLTHFNGSNFKYVEFFATLHNDFEDVIFREHPVLPEIKDTLYQNNAFYVSMSGSGSTIFGLFQNSGEAEAAGELLQQDNTFICKYVKWGYEQIA